MIAEADRYSRTAQGVAIARAVHQFMDHEPLILRDPLAVRILGPEAERWMRANLDLYRTERLQRIRGMVAIRSRLAEDELGKAMARGLGQYVILGAGLDTFAYRRPDLADRLTVFEVDEPPTQRWKQTRLAEAGIQVPPHVRYVPVDFNQGDLGDRLAAAGFDRAAPAVFAWLGVSYYLPKESILALLGFIAGQQAFTQVVFDFALDAPAVPPEFLPLLAEFKATTRKLPEAWKSWFVPEDLVAELRGLGFEDVQYLGAPTLQARYLAGRTDGLLAGPLMALVSARRFGDTA